MSRTLDLALAAIPNQASSGQLCGCSNAERLMCCWRPSQIRPHQDSYVAVATQALHMSRTFDVLLAAIPNQASSGQLCGCSNADTD
eukprot:scaffold909_cov131-Skeletonema_menzelii.AAC.7